MELWAIGLVTLIVGFVIGFALGWCFAFRIITEWMYK